MKITQAIAALAGIASASQPMNESTETYATKCNTATLVHPNNSHASCKTWKSYSGCRVGKRLYYTRKNNNICRDIGGHPARIRVRSCGAHHAYSAHAKRICIKSGLKWSKAPGAAWNIAYGGGKVWVIGTNVEGGGYGIYRWDGKWVKIPGSAIRAAVAANGRGWVVNKFGGIYGHNGARWLKFPGAAWDLDVSSRNKLWVIGTNKEAGGYGIYRWDTSKWTKVPGSAVRIAVDGSQNAWVVTKHRQIYRHNGSRWVGTLGGALDVAAHDGNVVALGTDRKPYRRWHVKNTWTQCSGGTLKSVAVGPGNVMYVTLTNAAIWAGH